MNTVPSLSVGILRRQYITFSLKGKFTLAQTQESFEGEYTAYYEQGTVVFQGKTFEGLLFEPLNPHESTFTLQSVVIGIEFHWEREEDQTFKGVLQFICENEALRAINILPVEDYLCSVISSEMAATSSYELLKAHTVISRSWVLSQIQQKKKATTPPPAADNEVIIKWYDREDHTLFDVCADDHCQRYQGISRITAPLVEQAVNETRGVVLIYADEICDARFSKCCGGIAERFESCWQEEPHPYLVAFYDHAFGVNTNILPLDLTQEEKAQSWIRSSPEAFCNTQDSQVLSQVLNQYDQETANFYRWTVEYSQEELHSLIQNRLQLDLGEIIDLVPLKRGPSGRIILLKIIGTQRTITVGKELEIRKTLSTSHLYSSAFVVDKNYADDKTIPERFTLTGAGWGHGVGLCQIGAAMMSKEGYTYQQILAHYFRGSTLEQRYT